MESMEIFLGWCISEDTSNNKTKKGKGKNAKWLAQTGPGQNYCTVTCRACGYHGHHDSTEPAPNSLTFLTVL